MTSGVALLFFPIDRIIQEHYTCLLGILVYNILFLLFFVIFAVGLVKNYSGSSSWPPGDPYASMPPGMPPRSSMGGPAGGHMGPVGSYPPMGGLSGDHQLRLHQEQMIQAQQARRMQQQAAVGGGMYGMPPPQGPGMMGPPMSHPPQGSGMPSGYSQPTAPPGKSTSSRQQPSKMH